MHITGTLTASFTDAAKFTEILDGLASSPAFTVEASDDQGVDDHGVGRYDAGATYAAACGVST